MYSPAANGFAGAAAGATGAGGAATALRSADSNCEAMPRISSGVLPCAHAGALAPARHGSAGAVGATGGEPLPVLVPGAAEEGVGATGFGGCTCGMTLVLIEFARF